MPTPPVNGDDPLRQIRFSPPEPTASILLGDHQLVFNPRALADPDEVTRITEAVRAAPEVLFDVRSLLTAPEPFRADAIRFMRDVCRAGPRRITFIDCSESRYTTLSDAAFGCLCGHDRPTNCNLAVQLAVTATAIEDSDALPASCSRIRNRLKELGVSGYRVSQLVRMGQQVVDSGFIATSAPTQTDVMFLSDVLEENEIPDELIEPPGWRVTQLGITRLRSNVPEPVTTTPLVIRKRLIDIEGLGELWEIGWPRDGRWIWRDIDRKEASDRRDVLQLAQFGAPVTSENSATLVEYLAAFEGANVTALPVEHVARSMGWHTIGGELIFLCGRTVIARPAEGATGRQSPVEGDGRHIVASQQNAANTRAVRFVGSDIGEEQLVDGYHAHGQFEQWVGAVALLRPYPRALIAVYASFSSFLLQILDVANFVFSVAGPTSGGKTTTLRGAASVWGNPDESSQAAAIAVWDATRVWIERALAILRSIALILDETQRARRPEDIAQVIYDVCSGRGRGRGSLLGLRASGTWKAPMLTSGETTITSFSQDGGTRARTVELWGSPFGAASEQTAQIVTRFNAEILQHYGHAGPRGVAFLLANQTTWPGLRQYYQERRQHFQRRAGSNAVAGRLAATLAVIDVGAELMHLALPLPWPYENLVDAHYDELVFEAVEADTAVAALRHIYGWAYAHREECIDQRGSNAHAPANGCLGKWRHGEPDYVCLCILVPRLRAELRSAGYEPEATIRTWKDRGFLRGNIDHRQNPPLQRTTLRVRLLPSDTAGSPAETIAIRWSAIEAIIGLDDSDGTARPGQIGP